MKRFLYALIFPALLLCGCVSLFTAPTPNPYSSGMGLTPEELPPTYRPPKRMSDTEATFRIIDFCLFPEREDSEKKALEDRFIAETYENASALRENP